MSRFFKIVFGMNDERREEKHTNMGTLCGVNPETGQQFMVGETKDFCNVIGYLQSRRMLDFENIDFGFWHDGGDDATLEMYHDWESGLNAYMYRPKRAGIHYVYNGEPFDTLYHAAAYARQCDAETSDDNAELNHIVDQTFREFCENGSIWNQ